MSRITEYLRRKGLMGPPISRKFRNLNSRNLRVDSIVVTGKPPHRMATFIGDRVVGAAIRDSGAFQEQLISKVANYIGHDVAKKPIFLDIGANIGTHTVYALTNGFAKAVCVEPAPNNFMLLKVNQILNNLDDRCINVCAAISVDESKATLELSETNFGDHRMKMPAKSENSIYDEERRDTVDIITLSMDSLLKSNNINASDIGLVWIDTQGHEGHVLAAAKALETAKTPIVIEFWPYGLKRSDGYQRLREFLVRNPMIYDLAKPLDGQNIMSIAEIDAYFETHTVDGKQAATAHTDLLVLP